MYSHGKPLPDKGFLAALDFFGPTPQELEGRRTPAMQPSTAVSGPPGGNSVWDKLTFAFLQEYLN